MSRETDTTSASQCLLVPIVSPIKKRCARKDAPLTETGGDRGALLTDGTVDQQIERPRVLTAKRASGLLGHWKPAKCITTVSASLRCANQPVAEIVSNTQPHEISLAFIIGGVG